MTGRDARAATVFYTDRIWDRPQKYRTGRPAGRRGTALDLLLDLLYHT